MDDDRASAMMTPIAPISPASRNGTASGMSAARMPVVEANAETAAPVRSAGVTALCGRLPCGDDHAPADDPNDAPTRVSNSRVRRCRTRT